MPETQSSTSVSTKLYRIAETARKYQGTALTALSHNIDVEWLREAYRRTRKDGAIGVDGQTAEQYEQRLEENLRSLLDRAKSGTYRAPPVRRVHIPKGDGSETRPIGIPTFEDKILQRAVAMLLNAVYEQDFLNCSYGFRPKRSAHQALSTLRDDLMGMAGAWVIEIDVRKFFDNLDHARLMAILRQRVRDGVVLRLIGKWLRAGVLEDRELSFPEAGTPQGGVVSPVLANIFLHEVLDLWFEREVKPRLLFRASLVRYADDAVIAVQSPREARRIFEVLPKRFGKFGLELHPKKTRIVFFRRPRHSLASLETSKRRSRWIGRQKPGTFDFLGFTFLWMPSKARHWVIILRTAKNRLCRSVRTIKEWCRTHRHLDVGEQAAALGPRLAGHYAYFRVQGNESVHLFHRLVTVTWTKWLRRRSFRPGATLETIDRLFKKYKLPKPSSVRIRMLRIHSMTSRMR